MRDRFWNVKWTPAESGATLLPYPPKQDARPEREELDWMELTSAPLKKDARSRTIEVAQEHCGADYGNADGNGQVCMKHGKRGYRPQHPNGQDGNGRG